MPTSGGTGDYDPFARYGVGDGPEETAGDNAQAAGMVETDKMIEDNLSWAPYTQLANLTGRPAMTVPLHWTADGLPLGVQLVAPLRGEATLIRLASQLEAAHPWADRRPPL